MVKVAGGSQYETYGKTHYEQNKQKYVDQTAARRMRNRLYIRSLKEKGSCVDCPVSDWRVLDYDHTGEQTKSFNISDAITRGFSIEKIDQEIAKCVLRCANCHRIKTLERAGIV